MDIDNEKSILALTDEPIGPIESSLHNVPQFNFGQLWSNFG